MITWPLPIIEDIARRRAVLFIGSGVSKNALGANGKRPPTWEEFLKTGVAKCDGNTKHISKLIRNGDLLAACEIIKAKLDHEWERLLDQEFVQPRYRASQIHKDLFALDTRLVLTPNFDKIYDSVALSESNGTVQIKHYYDDDISNALRGDIRAIVKVHGSIDAKNRMIFTRSEYAKARYNYQAFYTVIDALLLTHSFIFIGCGLADPDMQMFLEKYSHTYPGSRPHFIVMPRGLHADMLSSVRKNLNLFPVVYDSKDNHRDLAQSLPDLVRQVEEKRNMIAMSQDW